MLKEFRGHTSYVNDAVFSADGSQVVSSSSDSSVRVWDSKTCECLQTFQPPQMTSTGEAAVNNVSLCPHNQDHLIVCNRTSAVHLMTPQGMVLKSFASGKREGGNFLSCVCSPRGDFIYCLGEDSTVYCFGFASGKLENVLPLVHERGAIGIAHHPHRNLLVTWAEAGPMKTWR